MMFVENQKISLRQLQALLLLDCFGTAVLFLPAELARQDGQACWLVALLGGVVFTLFTLLLTTLGKRLPNGTAADWFRSCFGNFFGVLLLLGLAGKLLLDGMLELRIFSEIICYFMLPSTPVWAISMVVLAVAGALAAQGTECRGRAAEILFLFVAIPLGILLLAVAISSKYHRILPLQAPSFLGMKDGIAAMSVVFQGLIFLYFIYPDLKQPAHSRRAVLKSSALTALVITGITFLCLAIYGKDILSEKLLPSLQMMERVSFTGVFLTRQDVLLLWFWMASVAIYLSGVLFFGALMGVQIFHQQETKRKTWLWLWLAAIFAASLLPKNLSAAQRVRMEIAPWLTLFYLVLVPILLLLFTRKGGEKNAKEKTD